MSIEAIKTAIAILTILLGVVYLVMRIRNHVRVKRLLSAHREMMESQVKEDPEITRFLRDNLKDLL